MSPTPGATLRRRLGRALVAAGVLLALLAGLAATALVVMRDRQEAITGTFFRAVTEADTVQLLVREAKAALEGYLERGDAGSVQVLETLGEHGGLAGGQAPDAGPELVAELGADHEAVRLRGQADEARHAWLALVDELVATVSAGGPGAVSAADRRAEQAAYAELDAVLTQYGTAVRAARAEANAQLRTWIEVTTVAFGVLVAGAVAAGVLLWVFLRRWVTDPLAALARDARMVAAGDAHHEVEVAGPGEVGDLARDVEAMRGRLVRLLDEAAAAREEIEASHAALEEQAEDLRRSNRDLEQFAYVASHDLQEPLRKVASFTQLLSTRYRGQLDERADQYIDFAVDGAKRMQRLINDLLGFSRVGRIGTEVTDVDLGAVLAGVVADLSETVEATGAEVVGEGLPTVRGEAPLLTQLLANLVGNALKFRHPDRAPVIRISADRVGEFWHLACRDNGIGIDTQYADRVFVIFQRLHPKDVYEGTGIGLALCKKIVEYHGGDIWVEPDVAEGTVIRWTLPASPASAAGGARDASPAGGTADGTGTTKG